MAQWSKPFVYSQEDPKKTGVVPAIIVGIGYQTEAPYHPLRHYDLTLTGPDASIGGKKKGFLHPYIWRRLCVLFFLEKIVKPYIEQRFPINQSRQTLFGHSLGGLFVLHTLFEHPDAYQTYIAGSPSIHWNKKLFLEKKRTPIHQPYTSDAYGCQAACRCR
ncbi:hypothetical protein BsIDN1_71290 [Bacillus safensis]|uniref:Ferri-bacillibactin esterase BesA n=1 Tax=Bacillus safensis TaxID=561879 RepID=A0A5S9MKM7_BACIA|nr:hypothetical protein BsIDN1_71290 [Bacillus safensis]